MDLTCFDETSDETSQVLDETTKQVTKRVTKQVKSSQVLDDMKLIFEFSQVKFLTKQRNK